MKRFGRRTILQGVAGSTLAVPTFASVASRAKAQTDKPRLLVYYLPNGRQPADWVPTGTNGALRFPTASAALQPYANRVLAIDALDNIAARNSPGAAHAMGTSTVMTSLRVRSGAELATPVLGVSLDQVIAKQLGTGSRFESLQWSAGEPGPCDVGGSSCAYTQSISWAGPGRHLGPTIEPAFAFERLFGTTVEGLTGDAATLRRQTRRSVLDFVLEDAQRLNQRLNNADQQKLDEYFTSLRSVEKTLNTVPSACENTLSVTPKVPYAERVEVFQKMIALAFQCDQTRVLSFMIEFGLSERSHDFLSAPGNHHGLSHYRSATQRSYLRRVETWQATQLAAMLRLLAQTPDPKQGMLLDNTCVLVIPSMGAGSNHDHSRVVPMLFGAQSTFETRGLKRSYGVGSEARLANFHVAILRGFGLNGSYGRGGAIFGDYGMSALAGVLS